MVENKTELKVCCLNCRHSDVRKARYSDGHLHDSRFCEVEPPKVFLSSDGNYQTKFPAVYDYWRCGKFEPKEAQEKSAELENAQKRIAQLKRACEVLYHGSPELHEVAENAFSGCTSTQRKNPSELLDYLSDHIDCDTTSNYGYPKGEYK